MKKGTGPFLVLVLALLFCALDASNARAEDAVLRFGAAGQLFMGPSRGGVLGTLALGIPIAPPFAIEVLGGLAVSPGQDGRGLLRIAVGAALEPQLSERLRLRVALRFAHIHDAPLSALDDHAGPTLAGDPDYGLEHVTALGGAIGLEGRLPELPMIIGGELELLGVVHGGPDGYGALGVYAGYVFE